MASMRANTTPVGAVGSGDRATTGELRQLREQREGMGSEQTVDSNLGGGSGASNRTATAETMGQEGLDGINLPPLPPMNIDYRYAMPVPGREGWVYNPFTNRPVDVRGVESGRLIYDERDPANRNPDGTLLPIAEMPNKFRVP